MLAQIEQFFRNYQMFLDNDMIWLNGISLGFYFVRSDGAVKISLRSSDGGYLRIIINDYSELYKLNQFNNIIIK